MKPLDGLRIVDVSEGPAGGLATMVLADFGADVVKVERPGGDPFRAHPAARLWLRGKRSVEWNRDDAEATRRLRALIVDTAVAVVSSLDDRELAPFGLDAESLRNARPDLVTCNISAFGRGNAFARLPQHEGLVAAKAGRMLSFRGVLPREGPIFAAVNVATHATSQAAAAAVIAALFRREATGEGAALATSLLRGLLPYEMGALFAVQLDRRENRTTEALDPYTTMPTLNYHPAQAADGRWLQFGNLLPHLVARFFELTGLDADLTDAHRREPVLMWAGSMLEDFRDRLLRRLQTKTAAEWMDVFVADGGVVAHPYQTTQQALDDPDLVDNGHVVARGAERQLGLVARLTQTPGEASWSVPAPGSTKLASLASERIGPRSAKRASALPLAGVTVVEFATIIAAPLGVSVLADLGARVIKVEPLEGDPFRGMMNGLGAARVNAGKESILVDLKAGAGRRIAQQLIARADVLIHNYRPGVPDKLGIGWTDARQLNPKLVYVAVNGYGPQGPGALRPSTHPIPGAALGGVLQQLGGALPGALGDIAELRETARRLTRANELNPDPNTSMVVATAAALGLIAVRRHGEGQQIFVDMFGTNAYANFDDFFDYAGKPERRSPDRDLLGLSPLYRLYRCKSGWIFLAAEQPHEEAALRRVLAEIGRPIARLDDLEKVFAADDAVAWEAMLVSNGVGCVRADAELPARFVLDDPLAHAEALAVSAPHAVWGEYLRHAPLVTTDVTSVFRGAPVAGEHTSAILSELGYSPVEVDALLASRAAR